MTETQTIPSDDTQRVLDVAVRLSTGLAEVEPRPGQIALMHDIAAAYEQTRASRIGEEPGRLVAEGPTGIGKSLAYLSVAAVAARRGERTLLSTEMLSLQEQLRTKDLPTIAAASRDTLDFELKWAVLKGFSNLGCLRAAKPTSRDADSTPEARAVAQWLLDGADDPNFTGDRATFNGDVTNETWNAVSVSSEDCIGAKKCPFADQCFPIKNRRKVAEAHIVSTNHHLLGIQAAAGFPVVLDNAELGPFHHIVVDEAHSLPSIVRSKGEGSVTAKNFSSVGKAVASLDHDESKEHKQERDALTKQADAMGVEVEAHLLAYYEERVKPSSYSTYARVRTGDNPLGDIGESTLEFVYSLLRKVDRFDLANHTDDGGIENDDRDVAIRRVRAEVDGLLSKITTVVEEEKPDNVVVWVERDEGRDGDEVRHLAKFSPVDAAPLLTEYVYGAMRTVVMLSGTLPEEFGRSVGIEQDTEFYASPFDEAYAESALHVPRVKGDSEAIAALTEDSRTSRKRMSTEKHLWWATDKVVDLVSANQGSALVLAATAKNGRTYANWLRQAMPNVTVLSQWDGPSNTTQVARWQEDRHAVLVGTKSFMTGVDARGDTCTLVIVDRPARAASNPVDDARVERLVASGFDKWDADRAVYAADAALALEQSAGRLIRSVTDSGMVAVLDPRLLSDSPFAYNRDTRGLYMTSLRRFTKKIATPSKALDWLHERRA